MISFLGGVSIFLLLGAIGILCIAVFLMLRQKAHIARSLDIQMLQVLLPNGATSGQDMITVTEKFLSTLAVLDTSPIQRILYGAPIIVFEMLNLPIGGIVFYAGTEKKYIDQFKKQLYAHYPEAEVTIPARHALFHQHETVRVASLELRRKHYLPLATYKELGKDPMLVITNALATIRNTDSAVIQYVFHADSGRGFEHGQQEGERTHKMQERFDLVREKMSQQQFSVNIRVGIAVQNAYDAERVFQGIIQAFHVFDLPGLNQLRVRIPKNKKQFIEQMVYRLPNKRRTSVLSAHEIASLFHFPVTDAGKPSIVWRNTKAAPAPEALPTSGVLLGNNEYRGVTTPLFVDDLDRRRHMYLIGQAKTGRIAMLMNMILQDIRTGKGVGVVDSGGDLIEEILQNIPKERMKDVVLLGQAHSSFDAREIMDNQKILLCNLSGTKVGDTNSDSLGFAVISTIQHAAAERANMPEADKKDFYLYLDEFQDYTIDNIASILSEARTHRINLILSHQSIAPLDDSIQGALFDSVGTFISFRIGAEDAVVMERQFAPVFSRNDLMSIPNFSAVARLLVGGTPERACSFTSTVDIG